MRPSTPQRHSTATLDQTSDRLRVLALRAARLAEMLREEGRADYALAADNLAEDLERTEREAFAAFRADPRVRLP